MARPLCFSSCDCITPTCSLSDQAEDIDNEDCLSLYLTEPITERAQGDPDHSSLVTGVADRDGVAAAAEAKDQVEKTSQLVTGVIAEQKTLDQNHGPTSPGQKPTAQTAAPDH